MSETDEERANDPAFAPVEEAGGGVSEGFEQAERDLVDRIEDPNRVGAHPLRHKSVEDVDATESTGEPAEADREYTSERPDDDR